MKKSITLLLAILMVVSVFAACGKPAEGPESSTPPSDSNAPATGGNGTDAPSTEGPGGETTPPETEPQNEYELIGIPELNYGEATIGIACWNSEQPEFGVTADDANTGDPILDAIYKRNLYTEQNLGVTLEYTPIKGAGSDTVHWCDTIKNMQSDPSSPVDILAGYSRNVAYATVRGLNQDLTVYDYIDLEKDWWPKNVQEEFMIGNKLFFITGDISTNVLHMMYCIFYNKTLAEAHGLEDPVQLVNDKAWTMAKWQEMSKNIYEDIDGVAGKTPGDIYGSTFQYYHLDAIVQGCGFTLLENTTEEGNYMVVSEDFYSQKMDEYVSNMIEWVNTNDIWNDRYESANGSTETAFLEGRSAFQIQRAQFGFSLQETDLDYGILPPPMLDPSAQESYKTSLGNPYTIYCISRSTKDGDRAAAVLQTLGYYGKQLTTPAIFDVTFKGKFSKDPNAIDMFNVVKNAIGFDLGILYMKELNNMCDMITYSAISGNKQWSAVASNAFAKKTMNTKLERLNRSLDNIVNS